MPRSQVPQVEVKNNDDVDITVQVVGFTEGMPVEVYGYLTQDNGTYGSFRVTQNVPQADGAGVATILVTVSPQQLKLAVGEPVTVVTWVSEVWPSMLTTAAPDTGFKAAWTINNSW